MFDVLTTPLGAVGSLLLTALALALALAAALVTLAFSDRKGKHR